MKGKWGIIGVLIMMLCMTASGCMNQAGKEEYDIQLDTVYDGKEVDLCHEAVREYLDATEATEQARILCEYEGKCYDYQNMQFEWTGNGDESYKVYFADNKEFENPRIVETNDNYLCNFGTFIPGKTYYWKVVGDTEESTSAVDSFRTTDKPVRFISNNSIINVRDIGGWSTTDNKKVKYGLIYRGGRTNIQGGNYLDEEDVKTFHDELGIRTEIDLRTAGRDDGEQMSSVFGKDVSYTKPSISQYTYIIPGFYQEEPRREFDSSSTSSINKIFKILSDEENYPIYFHCNAGADRTGTLAFLINGLLGVSYEDLTRDFELTSFSKGSNRWRSGIDGATKTFKDSGVMQDDYGNFVAWEQFYKRIMEDYGTEDGSLQGAVENYLITACHLEQGELDAIKSIMLE